MSVIVISRFGRFAAGEATPTRSGLAPPHPLEASAAGSVRAQERLPAARPVPAQAPRVATIENLAAAPPLALPAPAAEALVVAAAPPAPPSTHRRKLLEDAYRGGTPSPRTGSLLDLFA